MGLNLALGWLMVLASIGLYAVPGLSAVGLAAMRLGIFQLAIARVGSGGSWLPGALASIGSAIVLVGHGASRPDLIMIGTVMALTSALLIVPRRPLTFLVVALAFGLDLALTSKLLAFPPNDVEGRMLRLASVAAIALPYLGLLFDDLVPKPEEAGRMGRWGRTLKSVGTVGMPLVLTAAAVGSINFKYLLFIPADAMTIAIFIAAILAARRSWLEASGFWLLALSMSVGLLMGGYAFDGPLPSPVGEYADWPRLLLRHGHVAVMVVGLSVAAFAQDRRAARVGAAARGASFLGADLDRLNQGSLVKSFVPQVDLDWSSATTDQEYERLYEVWSLLKGSGKDAAFTSADRVRFVKVQQITLMRFTALLERHGMFGIARLYDEPIPRELADYVGHFIKEETYHYSMFVRAIEQIEESLPAGERPPWLAFDRSLRAIFFLVGLVPSSRLRLALTFTMFRFAEQVTIYAHDQVRKTLPRREGLIAQVWARHAMDEARHLKFDDMVVERMRLPGALARLPELLILPACVAMSALLNANEIWAARRLGAKVRLWNLPGLVKRTEAPFKRRVFGLVKKMLAGTAAIDGNGGKMSNPITKIEPVIGEKAYVFALKHRALRHHALGYGTWSIDLGEIEALRKAYSRKVAPITYVPIYVKATALAVKKNPEANAILFNKPFGKRIVHFDQIDVNLPIIRTLEDGRQLTFIGTIRNAAEKSLAEIQAELTAYQRADPKTSHSIQRVLRFAGKPLWFARLIHWLLTWSPKFYIENVGTTALTFAPQPARAAHAFVEGDWYEHFFPTGPATVCFCIGSVRREPVVRGDQVVIRRMMRCTGMMDNYVLAGHTAAQLAIDFKQLLESGAFIAEELAAKGEAG